MARIPRNRPCPCGSGTQYKRCCASIKLDTRPGVDGLERPPDIPVEASFNEFVVESGGHLVSSMLSNSCDRPENADYFFPEDNVVAELKCFEKDLFNCIKDVDRIFGIIAKHRDSGAVSGHMALLWALGQERIPREYRRDMVSLARRSIETVLRKANKQIAKTKFFLGAPDARGLVLLANDGNYFSDPSEAVTLICQVMQEHFLQSNIDGFVFFTVNVVARDPRTDRELAVWVPACRQEGSGLGAFVNKLGADWRAFYSRTIARDAAGFETEDLRVLKMMRLNRPGTPR